MRLLFVRHGHPNYELDCLTDLGHLQAEAAAERLMKENIDVLTMTATPIPRTLHMSIVGIRDMPF